VTGPAGGPLADPGLDLPPPRLGDPVPMIPGLQHPLHTWLDRRDHLGRRTDPAWRASVPSACVRPGLADEPRRATFGFPLAASTPRRARRHTVDLLRRCGLDDLTDTAELLVSELMTNALEASRAALGGRPPDPAAAAAPLQLRLLIEHGHLRIEVRDHNPRPPVPGDPGLDDERGRGLQLVDTFSHRWGFHRLRAGGKVVWCVVAPPSGDPTR